MKFARVLGGALIGLLVACASSTQPGAQAPVAAVVAAPVKPAVAPLTAVDAPSDLFLVARVNNISETVDTFASWSNMPLPWQDLLKTQFPDLFQHVRLDQPIDVALTLDPDSASIPKVLGVVSIPLTSQNKVVDALRNAGRLMEHISPDLDYFAFDENVQCAVARSNGAAPARLVCGSERKAVESLTGYITTNLAAQRFTERAALMQFKAEALRARFGKRANLIKSAVPLALRELSLGSARFDTALADALYALADEVILWVDDIDGMDMSLILDGAKGEMVAETSLRFRRDKSYLASATARAVQDAATAPDMFWQLPADVTSGAFSVKRQSDARQQQLLGGVSELILGAFEHYGIANGAVTKWNDAYRRATATTPVSVSARGNQTGVKVKSVEEQAAIDAMGYYAFGVDSDDGAYAALLDATVQILNDKKLRSTLTRQASWVSELPTFKTRTVSNKGAEPSSVQLYELTVKVPAQKTPKATKAFSVTPVIASTVANGRTWFVIALNEQLAIAKLKQLVAPDAVNTLKSRADLELLRQNKTLIGSYSTLEGFMGLFGFALEVSAKGSRAELERAMPHRGKTPFFVDIAATAEGPALRYRFSVPKGVFEDAAAAGVAAAALFGKALGDASDSAK